MLWKLFRTRFVEKRKKIKINWQIISIQTYVKYKNVYKYYLIKILNKAYQIVHKIIYQIYTK